MRLCYLVLLTAFLAIPAAALAAEPATGGSADTLGPTTVETAAPALDTAAAAGAATPEYPMDPERKAKLISYSRFVNIWRFADLIITCGILALILFTGLSARMRTLAQRIFRRRGLAVAGFVVLFMAVDFLLNLPFSIYRNYMVESDYGFVNQSFGGWFGEAVLSLVVACVIAIIAVSFLYWVINRFRRWWLVFMIGAIPFTIFFIVIAPVLISPLFNDFVPIQNQGLGTKLVNLAESVGIHDPDVFQINASKQSSKINAYVTGLFGTKRIVLYDTLIDNFTDDEILFVMGHEMGHYVKHHIWWGLAVALVYIGFLVWLISRIAPALIRRFQRRFGFSTVGDVASLPLLILLLTVLEFGFQPITNTYSRMQEHVCDKYGVDVTGVDGETAARAFDKLAVYNLSDPSPSPLVEFWFYDHPALEGRMAFVREYAAQTVKQPAVRQ
ncbi:MAG TPA: M48 family metallopeptidase [candidate division Zixibacteria bacterium]|nr:M48 family metallopeptidase [candidate division Zixibacteria bacterium]MDD4917339.1 M48 family metallopeptidase [candidate division Zixibacteria bacterium]MDM7971897.1 M48 family metallopeptidase [candidate division Zixibacteria bacterium]HOD67218.1 M48 family metallopeptidase [candidate division Zixibacteria bacterium]HQL24071.1 M48 family metallopeptidase [candidate division Zixibacteria bacterium]